MDAVLPTVSSVAITGEEDGIQNSFLNAGDNVSVTATFSERVIVDNVKRQSDAHPGCWCSDNRTATICVRQTIVLSWCSGTRSRRPEHQERMTPMASASGLHALALDNGTIRDAALNDAILAHSVVDGQLKRTRWTPYFRL